MDFRAAARVVALNMGDDMDMELGTMNVQTQTNPWQHGGTPPSTDGMDPASPGGSAPYNGAEPFGEPVVADPEWLDPSKNENRRGHTMPYTPGPTENVTTLHNARRAQYAAKEVRNR
jgi:hypothetical protein